MEEMKIMTTQLIGTRLAGNVTDSAYRLRTQAMWQRRDHTWLFSDGGTYIARTYHYLPDGCIDIRDFTRCPKCGAVAWARDDGERSWIECPQC